MEDFIEVIIYIIITIVAIVGSVFKNKAGKDKQKQPEEAFFPDLDKGSGGMEPRDLFEEKRISDEKYVIDTEDKPVPFSVEEENEEEMYNYLEEGESAFQSTSDSLLSDDQPLDIVDLHEKEIEDDITRQSISDFIDEKDMTEQDFNLREAIVYSEIINRKYF